MPRFARWLGIVLQALVLGTLLTVALLELLVMADAHAVFHYQGF